MDPLLEVFAEECKMLVDYGGDWVAFIDEMVAAKLWMPSMPVGGAVQRKRFGGCMVNGGHPQAKDTSHG